MVVRGDPGLGPRGVGGRGTARHRTPPKVRRVASEAPTTSRVDAAGKWCCFAKARRKRPADARSHVFSRSCRVSPFPDAWSHKPSFPPEYRLRSNHPAEKMACSMLPRRHYGARGAPGRDHASVCGARRARRARGDRGRRFGAGRRRARRAAGARRRPVREGFGTRRGTARVGVVERRVLGERRRRAWRGGSERFVVGRVRRGPRAGRGAVPTVLGGGEERRAGARELRRAARLRSRYADGVRLRGDHRHRGAGRRGDAKRPVPLRPACHELRRAGHAGQVRRVRRTGHAQASARADTRRRRGSSRADLPARLRPSVPRDALRAHRNHFGCVRAGVRARRARRAARA